MKLTRHRYSVERDDHSDLTPALLGRLVLASLGDGIVTVDARLRVTSMNPAAERLLRVPASEAVGRRCYSVLSTDRCHSDCPLRHTLTTGQPRRDESLTFDIPGEHMLPTYVTTDLLCDESGEAIGAVETIRPTGRNRACQVNAGVRHPVAPPPPAHRRPSTRAIMEARILQDPQQHGSLEAQRLADVLQAHGWRREETAGALGISRSTLWRRMKDLGLLS
jgi:transcriptional regulator with PAS, ATPase and Fis domain